MGLIILTILPILLLFYKSWRVQHSSLQKVFLSGTFPSPLPDGFYKGFENININWKGKEFDASASSGINLFGDKKVYPFKTYKGKGLQDKNLDVLKIDYNITKNPFWVRVILDEIVQTDKDKYLGKVHLKLIPNFPLSLGYFNLEK